MVELAQQAVAALQPMLPDLVSGVASSALWDWIKNKLSGPSHVHVIEQVERNPERDSALLLLAGCLAGVLEEKPELSPELKGLLSCAEVEDSQVSINVGDGNKTAQTRGNNNTVTIN